MTKRFKMSLNLLAPVLLSACATTLPNSPTVMVLPGGDHSFEHFRNDQAVCQQFASAQLAGSSVSNEGSEYDAQQYFDMAYIQCMYAKGHQVPVSGQFADKSGNAPVGADSIIPPPPAGTPPPPPPPQPPKK